MADDGTAELDQLAINTIRFLAVDMVEKAESGHPGAPLGQAPLAYLLWTRHMRHNPDHPDWPNRDRFVLSCGHASALLYALLHLSGYGLHRAELESFRQLGSLTPGHPELHHTRGVETTTGPLGQGFGNAVGMAMAERLAAAHWNREDFPLFDHRIWVIASDGDLMEGVAAEAASLAGHLKLGQLVVFYDDNEVSIDGPTSISFTENVSQRFEAYGWRVLQVADGNDLEQLETAITDAASQNDRPTLVRVRTVIGFGSPKKAGTAEAHGSPLGKDEVAATKKALGWPLEPTFLVPDEAKAPFEKARERGRQLEDIWKERFEAYHEEYPEEAADLARRLAGELPADWESALPAFSPADKPVATRAASGQVLNALAAVLPELVGGSADLTPSNNTFIKGSESFSPEHPEGRNLRFGVREHAMGAVLNGISLSGLYRPYGGTFLIFSDYMRPAIRLAALMKQPVVYVFTHDSIFLGEDGPTHQPISQLASLRAIPNLTVIRPADAAETAAAWQVAVANQEGPTALILTRQNLPIQAETVEKARQGLPRGGYVLLDAPGGKPQILLIATGSEVAITLEAAKILREEGVAVRVVSLPSWDLFEAQSAEYRESVLPKNVRLRLAVEAASPFGWHKYVGLDGEVHGIDRFGASAPAKDLAKEFGFTALDVAAHARKLLAG